MELERWSDERENKNAAMNERETSLMNVGLSFTVNEVLSYFVNNVTAHQQQINRAFDSLLNEVKHSQSVAHNFDSLTERSISIANNYNSNNSSYNNSKIKKELYEKLLLSLSKTVKASETLFRFLFECIYVHQLETNLAFVKRIEEMLENENSKCDDQNESSNNIINNNNIICDNKDNAIKLRNTIDSARRVPLAVQRCQARYMVEMASLLISTTTTTTNNNTNNASEISNNTLISDNLTTSSSSSTTATVLPTSSASPSLLQSSKEKVYNTSISSVDAASITHLHDKIRLRGGNQAEDTKESNEDQTKSSVNKENINVCSPYTQRQKWQHTSSSMTQRKEGLERALKFSFAISASYSLEEQQSLMHMLTCELRVPALILPRQAFTSSKCEIKSNKSGEEGIAITTERATSLGYALNEKNNSNSNNNNSNNNSTKEEEWHDKKLSKSSKNNFEISENEAQMALLLRCRYLITPHSPPPKPCVHFVKREVLQRNLQWSHNAYSAFPNTLSLSSSSPPPPPSSSSLISRHKTNQNVEQSRIPHENRNTESVKVIKKTSEDDSKDEYEQEEEEEEEEEDEFIFEDSELYELLQSLDKTLNYSTNITAASSYSSTPASASSSLLEHNQDTQERNECNDNNIKNNNKMERIANFSLPNSPKELASSQIMLKPFDRRSVSNVVRISKTNNKGEEEQEESEEQRKCVTLGKFSGNHKSTTSLSAPTTTMKRMRGTIERASWTQARNFASGTSNTLVNNCTAEELHKKIRTVESDDKEINKMEDKSECNSIEDELVLVVPSQNIIESQCVTYWHHDNDNVTQIEDDVEGTDDQTQTNTHESCLSYLDNKSDEGEGEREEEVEEEKENTMQVCNTKQQYSLLPQYIFQISNTLKEMKPLLLEAIKKLGGRVDNSVHFNSNTTHFVMLEGLPERTEKYLSCCAANVAIVPPRFVFESARRGYWINGKLLREFDMNPRRRHPCSWRNAPFAPWRVILCTSNSLIASGIDTVLRAGGCTSIETLLFDAAPQINRRFHESMIPNFHKNKRNQSAKIQNKNNVHNDTNNNNNNNNNNMEKSKLNALNANSEVDVNVFNNATHVLLECNTMATAPYLGYFELPIWFPFQLRRSELQLWSKLYTLEVLYYTLCTSSNIVFDQHDGKLISEDYLTYACRVSPSSFTSSKST